MRTVVCHQGCGYSKDASRRARRRLQVGDGPTAGWIRHVSNDRAHAGSLALRADRARDRCFAWDAGFRNRSDARQAQPDASVRADGSSCAVRDERGADNRRYCRRECFGSASYRGRSLSRQPDRRSLGHGPRRHREIRRARDEECHRARFGQADLRCVGHARRFERSHLQGVAEAGAFPIAGIARLGRHDSDFGANRSARVDFRGLGGGAYPGEYWVGLDYDRSTRGVRGLGSLRIPRTCQALVLLWAARPDRRG